MFEFNLLVSMRRPFVHSCTPSLVVDDDDVDVDVDSDAAAVADDVDVGDDSGDGNGDDGVAT